MKLKSIFKKKTEDDSAAITGDKELKMFFLPGCPYCRMADDVISGLISENPEFKNVSIKKVNEISNSALAARYDYWRTPSFFLGADKLYEASPGDNEQYMKETLKDVFSRALAVNVQ